MSFLSLMSRDDLEGITSGAEIDPKRAGCGSVGQVQLALKQQGYYDGPLTGAFNDEMADAMQEFLADQGMSASASNEEFCQALRTAQMELSSKARSEVNSRILGVNPILLLLGAAAVVVGAIKLRGGMRPNKSSVVDYAAYPLVYSSKSRPRYKQTKYKSRSAAMAVGKEIARKIKKAIKTSGNPKVEVYGHEDEDGSRYYVPSISYRRRTWYGKGMTKAEDKKDRVIQRKVIMLRGKGYNRMHIAS